MRVSEFWVLAEGEFGRVYARSLASDLVLHRLADRTAGQALADGEEPARIWAELCEVMDVPVARRGGPVPPAKRRGPAR